MIDPDALVGCLAKAVAKGLLPRDHAEATIAATVGAAWRKGELAEVADPATIIHSATYHLECQSAALAEARGKVIEAIVAAAWPMIADRVPSNRLRAELHEINGAHGFPLQEDEVDQGLIGMLYEAKEDAEAAAMAEVEAELPPEQPRRRRRRFPMKAPW